MSTTTADTNSAKPYDSPEILSLLHRSRQGDTEAFAQLYTLYKPRVFTTCNGVVREPDTAEYLANGVLARVWFKLKGFKGTAAFATWLTRIATTQSLLYLRQQKADRQYVVYSLDEPHLEQRDRDAFRLELAVRDLNLEGVVDKNALLAAIATLSDKLREVVILRLMDGLNIREAALALGLQERTVKSRLWNARRILVKNLKP